jgi:hypothetical protein
LIALINFSNIACRERVNEERSVHEIGQHSYAPSGVSYKQARLVAICFVVNCLVFAPNPS